MARPLVAYFLRLDGRFRERLCTERPFRAFHTTGPVAATIGFGLLPGPDGAVKASDPTPPTHARPGREGRPSPALAPGARSSPRRRRLRRAGTGTEPLRRSGARGDSPFPDGHDVDLRALCRRSVTAGHRRDQRRRGPRHRRPENRNHSGRGRRRIGLAHLCPQSAHADRARPGSRDLRSLDVSQP